MDAIDFALEMARDVTSVKLGHPGCSAAAATFRDDCTRRVLCPSTLEHNLLSHPSIRAHLFQGNSQFYKVLNQSLKTTLGLVQNRCHQVTMIITCDDMSYTWAERLYSPSS
jgi:hypothetical protein